MSQIKKVDEVSSQSPLNSFYAGGSVRNLNNSDTYSQTIDANEKAHSTGDHEHGNFFGNCTAC